MITDYRRFTQSERDKITRFGGPPLADCNSILVRPDSLTNFEQSDPMITCHLIMHATTESHVHCRLDAGKIWLEARGLSQ